MNTTKTEPGIFAGIFAILIVAAVGYVAVSLLAWFVCLFLPFTSSSQPVRFIKCLVTSVFLVLYYRSEIRTDKVIEKQNRQLTDNAEINRLANDISNLQTLGSRTSTRLNHIVWGVETAVIIFLIWAEVF